MKNINVKFLILGTFLTLTLFLGVAATGPTDKWDDNQEWRVFSYEAVEKLELDRGEQPFAVTHRADGSTIRIWARKRDK